MQSNGVLNPRRNKFDISSTTLSLHSLDPETQKKIIGEMRRVTKINGRIVLADYVIPIKKNLGSTMWNLVSNLIEMFVGANTIKIMTGLYKMEGFKI